MNSQSSNAQTLDVPRTVTAELTESLGQRSRPPSLVDRITMRVGLALVLWSRRENRSHQRGAEAHTLAATRSRVAMEREARERAWLASGHSVPRR